MNHAYKGLCHGLSHGENVLKSRPAALVAILHKQPILLVLLHIDAARRIAQVRIKPINPVAKVVELLHAVAFIIEDHQIRIRLGREPFGIDLDRYGPSLVAVNSNQSASPRVSNRPLTTAGSESC